MDSDSNSETSRLLPDPPTGHLPSPSYTRGYNIQHDDDWRGHDDVTQITTSLPTSQSHDIASSHNDNSNTFSNNIANHNHRRAVTNSTDTKARVGDNSNNHVVKNNGLDYSPQKAQLLSTFILLLYGIAMVPGVSLMSQYLLARWRLEAGHNITQALNGSFCGRANNSDTAFEDALSAKVSTVTTYYNYVISGVAVVSSLLLGAYADVIGRRILILAPAFTSVINYAINICVMRFDLSTNYFYLSSTVLGLGGSFYAMLVGVFSATSDLQHAKSTRVLWLALQMCVTSVTLALGNIGIGYIIKYLGFYQATIVLEIPAVICFVVALLFMPETLPKERKFKTSRGSLHPIRMIGRVFRIYTVEGSRSTRTCLWICLFLFFFAVIPDLNLSSLDTIYQLHRPLCWDSTQIGFYAAIQTGGKKLLGTLLLKGIQMTGWIQVEKLAMVVCLFQAGSMVLEALAQNSWQMYLVPLVGTPGVITVPVIRGIMSFLVGPQNLGALFASIATMETICSVSSGTSINRVYTQTVDVMPGAVYYLMAAFAGIAFLLFVPLFYFYEDPTKTNPPAKDTNSC